MELFNTNLKYLKRNYPNLLSVINENKEIDSSVYTKNNEPNMTLIMNGRETYLHSKYNATAEAEKWVSTIDGIKSVEHIFVFGIGLGYFLEALLKLLNASHIYICEPSIDVFNHMIRTRDIRELMSNPKIKLFAVGSEDLLLSQIAAEWSLKISTNSLELVSPPVYRRLYEDIFDHFINKIKNSIMDQAANLQTLHTFEDLWLSSILKNIPYTIENPPLQNLKNTYAGATAIIVGSGPSLQTDIEYLRDLKDKCLVIAAGSSIQALQYNGIHPDLVVSIDGGVANLRVFENIDTSQSPLLFCSQIHSGILDIYEANMTFGFLNNDLINSYLWKSHEIPQFLNTTTVTGTAIQAAVFMGVSKIILTGQDLSYPANRFYSSGVNHISKEEQVRIAENAELTVENVNGELNPTTAKMMITLQDLELLIYLLTVDSDIVFINTSSNGAKIKGTEFKRMSEIMEDLKALPCVNYNLNAYIVPRSEQDKQQLYETIREKLFFIFKQCELVKQKIKSLLSDIRQLERNVEMMNIKQIQKTLVRTEKTWGWLTKREVFTVFFTFAKGHHINVYKRYIHLIVEAENPIKKAELVSEHLGDLVETLHNFLPELHDLLHQAIGRLDIYATRSEEENE